MNRDLYSAIDANLNRCSEGLRVCEDIFRFYARNTTLSSLIKEIRHSLRQASMIFPADLVVSSRDVENDGQKFVDTEAEGRRSSVLDLFMANVKRAEESLRFLEESSKLVSLPGSGASFQAIRFRVYDMEKDAFLFLKKSARIGQFEKKSSLVILLEKGGVYDFKYEKIEKSGAGIVLLDGDGADDPGFLSAAMSLRRICDALGSLFFIKSRCDIAQLSSAEGVVLSGRDISVYDAEKILPASFLRGRMIESYNEMESVKGINCDFLVVEISGDDVFDDTMLPLDVLQEKPVIVVSADPEIMQRLGAGIAASQAATVSAEELC